MLHRLRSTPGEDRAVQTPKLDLQSRPHVTQWKDSPVLVLGHVDLGQNAWTEGIKPLHSCHDHLATLYVFVGGEVSEGLRVPLG